MPKYIACVDIGGTKIAVSLADRFGFVVRLVQRTQLKGKDTAVPSQVHSLISAALTRVKAKPSDISAVGVSTCGPFFVKRGLRCLVAPNLCGGLAQGRGILPNDWTEVPLEKELARNYKKLVIENDAVAGAIAEKLFGTGKAKDNFMYVTWSTGIGSGAYVDGQLIHGKNGNAPHIGHVYMTEDGPQCGCGNFGDMEGMSSGTAIARDYGGGVGADMVFERMRAGDAKARRVIERAAWTFARGLASANAVLDTELIIIGGSVFLNNVDILLPILNMEFFLSSPPLTDGCRIVPSRLGEYLGEVASLSLVIPPSWIARWARQRPWQRSPAPILL